jgi:hypothetical protein
MMPDDLKPDQSGQPPMNSRASPVTQLHETGQVSQASDLDSDVTHSLLDGTGGSSESRDKCSQADIATCFRQQHPDESMSGVLSVAAGRRFSIARTHGV